MIYNLMNQPMSDIDDDCGCPLSQEESEEAERKADYEQGLLEDQMERVEEERRVAKSEYWL